MDTKPIHFEWKTTIINTYQQFVEQMIEIMPQILGALGLIFLGWLLGHLIRLITYKALSGLDHLIHRITKGAAANDMITSKSYAAIISKAVFWAVLLFFITAATNLLGWEIFAGWMDALVRQLPNLILGALIIVAGFILGGSIRHAVYKSLVKTGANNAEIMALATQIIVVLASVIIGAEQMDIHVGFLTMLLTVVIGVLLAGACLAFGLGAQGLVANILGAQYARKHCRIGEVLKIGGSEGEILEVTQTAIILETKDGRCIVPAKMFHSEVSVASSVSTAGGSVFGGFFNKEESARDEQK